jgi:uncharacterized membrane protein
MDAATSILFVIMGIIGIIMASIGINFFNKCKNGTELPKANKHILIALLVGFILLITVIGAMAAVQVMAAAQGVS